MLAKHHRHIASGSPRSPPSLAGAVIGRRFQHPLRPCPALGRPWVYHLGAFRLRDAGRAPGSLMPSTAPLSTGRRQAVCVESAVLSRGDCGLSQRLLTDVLGLSQAGIGACLRCVAKALVVPGSLDQIDAQSQDRKKALVAEIWFDPPANTGAHITVGASADPAGSQVNTHRQSSVETQITSAHVGQLVGRPELPDRAGPSSCRKSL
jgi:hypothetical protein